MNTLPAICSYEDRPENMVGWKLLLASLARHSPSLPIYLFSKEFPESFKQWIENQGYAVNLIPLNSRNLLGWNNKPLVIQHMFSLGIERILWVDSDIIVTRDVIPRLKQIPEQAVAVTLENGRFDERRVTCHGLEVARRFKGNLNTSLIHVHQRYHAELIEQWRKTLESPYFQEIQLLSHEERPVYCWSEQDVFAGLLCAKIPGGFANLDLEFFALNKDIVHAGSPYRLKARLLLSCGSSPLFLHAQGFKPWCLKKGDKATLEEIQVELSLYLHEAKPYTSQLDEEAPWIYPRSFRGKLFHALFLGNPHLRGVPPLLLSDLKSFFGKLLNR